MRSLCGLFFFGASHPTRVRRNARKRQRPAFDGAPPAKANGDRVASTRPAGAALRSRRRSMCPSPKPTPPMTQMSCLRSVYRIPAGIRLCCAVPPASQCRVSIWLFRYEKPNAKSALSIDVRVWPFGVLRSGQAKPVPRERTDSPSFACRAYLIKNKPAGAYASTGCFYDLSDALVFLSFFLRYRLRHSMTAP